MLANRVKETTSTTGLLDFTTSGAVAGYQTFNTAFGADFRFYYWAVNDTDNEWESGIGYMSTSTTLVRETILSSTNADAKVSFTTAPSLFSAENENHAALGWNAFNSAIPYYPSIRSDHVVSLANVSTVANRIVYVPYVNSYTNPIHYFSVLSSGAWGASKIMLGLYQNGSDGLPGQLIATTTAAAANLGVISSSISPTPIQLGIGTYWAAIWSDGILSMRGGQWQYSAGSALVGVNYEGRNGGYLYVDGQTGLTTFAQTAVAPTAIAAADYPSLMLEPNI